MPTFVIFVAVAFQSNPDAPLPGTEEMGEAVKKAVVDAFNAQSPKLWGLVGLDDTKKQVRVVVSSAAIRFAPSPNSPVYRYVTQGMILTLPGQLGEVWTEVDGGWIKTNQVVLL